MSLDVKGWHEREAAYDESQASGGDDWLPESFHRTRAAFHRDAAEYVRKLEAVAVEEPWIERLRRLIEEQYEEHRTGCGGSFGELLCYELHSAGLTFTELAEKWGISLPTLGELVNDHCRRLEAEPRVRHSGHPQHPVEPEIEDE